MTITEAVLRLRTHLKMSQAAFAQSVGIGLRSLCRIEKGGAPGVKALMGLSDLSKRPDTEHLHAIFEALVKGELTAKSEDRKLYTPGTARRVAFDQLRRWAIAQNEAYQAVELILQTTERIAETASTATDIAMLVKSINAEMLVVRNGAQYAVGSLETVQHELMLHILGPGSVGGLRADAIELILYPERRSLLQPSDVPKKYATESRAEETAMTKRLKQLTKPSVGKKTRK